MPHWSQAITDRIQTEIHFDGREIKCFKDRPADLNAMLAAALDRAPDQEAVVSGETRLTYTELDQHVGRIAAGLRARGVEKGDRSSSRGSHLCVRTRNWKHRNGG